MLRRSFFVALISTFTFSEPEMDGDEEIPAEHQTDEVSFFANFIV